MPEKKLPTTHTRPALSEIKENLGYFEARIDEGEPLDQTEIGIYKTLQWVLGQGKNPNEN